MKEIQILKLMAACESALDWLSGQETYEQAWQNGIAEEFWRLAELDLDRFELQPTHGVAGKRHALAELDFAIFTLQPTHEIAGEHRALANAQLRSISVAAHARADNHATQKQ